MKFPITAVIAVAAGLVVLLGYFLPIPGLTDLRSLLLSWAVILAAVAAWIGISNLLAVHLRKIRAHRPDAPYSAVLLGAFALTLAAGIGEYFLNPAAAPLQWAVSNIQVPVEASLLALLSVTLVYAAFRLLRQRRDMLAVLFLASAVAFLVVGSGMLDALNVPILHDLALALNRLPVAGMRGILLGVALGSLTTGLRILMGADRPYGG